MNDKGPENITLFLDRFRETRKDKKKNWKWKLFLTIKENHENNYLKKQKPSNRKFIFPTGLLYRITSSENVCLFGITSFIDRYVFHNEKGT